MVNLSKETMEKLAALCREHAPELGETLLEELARFESDPEQPWQNHDAAVKLAWQRYAEDSSFGDDLEIDDDAALSAAEEGV